MMAFAGVPGLLPEDKPQDRWWKEDRQRRPDAENGEPSMRAEGRRTPSPPPRSASPKGLLIFLMPSLVSHSLCFLNPRECNSGGQSWLWTMSVVVLRRIFPGLCSSQLSIVQMRVELTGLQIHRSGGPGFLSRSI